MDGMASVLNYQQSIEDLQHSLICTTLELKSVQLAVRDEKRRHEEYIKQLLQILNAAFQARDEAKDHLQRLVNKIMQSGISQFFHVVPCGANPESPPVLLSTVGNSSIPESDSLSETYNHHSYISSSVDTVSPSPGFSNINATDSINMEPIHLPCFVQEYSTGSSSIGLSSEVGGQLDPAAVLIDRLAMRKPLPEKGKLLQAVVEAGPLLQTLLLAGPLPQWRNPPPLQPLQLPISIKGPDPAELVQKPLEDLNYQAQSPQTAFGRENSKEKTQTCSTSILSFPSTGGSCMKKQLVPSSGSGTDLFHYPRLV